MQLNLTYAWWTANGESFVSYTTKITPKGQTYFLDKIKEKINAIGKWWGK